MDAEEQRLEVEPAHADDDDLAVDDTALGQRRGEGCDELGEVTVHRLLVAALQHDLVAVAKHQRPKAVPLGLELPAVAARQGIRGLGQLWTAWARAAERRAGACSNPSAWGYPGVRPLNRQDGDRSPGPRRFIG